MRKNIDARLLQILRDECNFYLQQIVSHSFEEFDRRSGGEIAGPIRMRITRVREEVIAFRRPLKFCIVYCFQITRWRRIKYIHFGSFFFLYVSTKYKTAKVVEYRYCKYRKYQLFGCRNCRYKYLLNSGLDNFIHICKEK